MENIIKDSRFSHIASDPRFKRFPKNERKVKIDKRFQSMFTGDTFKVKYAVDKRGRPINYSSNENLRKYYSLSSGDEDSSEEDDDFATADVSRNDQHEEEKLSSCQTKSATFLDVKEDSNFEYGVTSTSKTQETTKSKRKVKSSKTKSGFKIMDISENDSENLNTTENKISKQVKEKLKKHDIDYARGEGNLLSDSSSDEESSDDSVAEFEEHMAHEWGELDKDAGTTEQSTNRLAVCNMDWDRIKASDLMVLFSSFTPPEGIIESVAIYPSEFGKQRMKEEDMKGPVELIAQGDMENSEDDDDEAEEGKSFHMEKLRKYQLNRLKYFYAVVVCNSVSTADKIYAECDGLEYESSAIRLDLRFIPDDMTFDEEARDICNGIPDPLKYRPRYFVTKALQQAKVECTWDETNPDRKELTEKIMKSNGEINDEDIRAYLASSSDESEEENDIDGKDGEAIDEEEDEENRLVRYRSLIKEIREKENTKTKKDVEMEVTWGIGLKGKTEKMIKEKMKKQNEELTPFEKYLEKRKEKKKLKKKEAKKKGSGRNEEEAFSDGNIPSDVDLNDPYFQEELDDIRIEDKSAKKNKENIKKGNDNSSEDEAKRKHREVIIAVEDATSLIETELELLLMDTESKNHFNMNAIVKQEKNAGKKKKKRKGKKEVQQVPEDVFQIDVKDPRFDALYSSHHFNIDPADPHFRKTKAMEAIVSEKLNRRDNESKSKTPTFSLPESNRKKDPELSLLVKSVKRKAENMLANKKKKKSI